MVEKLSKSLEETRELARDFLASLNANNTSATVVGLSGDLGSGKTAFTQALARELGISEPITSPTFVLEKIYKLENQKFGKLIHVDAYRLEGGAELLKLGFAELLQDKSNLIIIEWVERVREILGEFREIDFKFIDEQTREIKY
ncbi:MAG: tRNA (adenosine(37)-N6)-threonylcarbamoyltransferase complex ATPase subunit type 1 TsaE [Patescibacteria group bacterium]